jgi:hypothetical protein
VFPVLGKILLRGKLRWCLLTVIQIDDKDACCSFAKSIPRMLAVFENTVPHAGNRFGCASLSIFVIYLKTG